MIPISSSLILTTLLNALASHCLAVDRDMGARSPEETTARENLKPCKHVAFARTFENHPWFQQEMRIDRLYDLSALSPLSFDRDTMKESANALDELHLKFRKIFVGLGLFGEPLQRSGVSSRPRLEYTTYTMEYDPIGRSRDWNEGQRFVVPTVYLSVVNGATAMDIQRVYAAIRSYQVRQLSAEPGSFDNPDETIGDACYHVGKDVIGFCRGNVIVELRFTTAEWRNGDFVGSGLPDSALREKMLDAARQIDDLLVREMFSEQIRTEIRGCEAERRNARQTTTQAAPEE
jgi:hypothetical protein